MNVFGSVLEGPEHPERRSADVLLYESHQTISATLDTVPQIGHDILEVVMQSAHDPCVAGGLR